MDRFDRRRYYRAGNGGLLIGGLIVVVGSILLLENMGILRDVNIWKFWPVVLIAVGLARITESHRPAALVWGGVIAAVGVLFLLDNLNVLIFDFRMIWPLIIIAFGVSMLVRAMDRGRGAAGGERPDSDATVSLYAVFSGGKRRLDSPDFQGGEVFALFGGFHLDLRGAKIPSGRAVLDVNAMFGGVEIVVPDTWRVKTKGMGIFGGFEDKTIAPRPQEGVAAPELIVTGSAIFGGATVRSKSNTWDSD